MCEGLQRICKATGAKNFELNVRISDENPQRWNHKTIESSIKPHRKDLRKIWVCGPPRMNEDFDKFLENLVSKMGLSSDFYEIM